MSARKKSRSRLDTNRAGMAALSNKLYPKLLVIVDHALYKLVFISTVFRDTKIIGKLQKPVFFFLFFSESWEVTWNTLINTWISFGRRSMYSIETCHRRILN